MDRHAFVSAFGLVGSAQREVEDAMSAYPSDRYPLYGFPVPDIVVSDTSDSPPSTDVPDVSVVA